MKRLLLIIALLLAMFANALAQSTYVRGYYRKDGTYVKGYYRKVRNHTNHDNYSTFANTNPHTGSLQLWRRSHHIHWSSRRSVLYQ